MLVYLADLGHNQLTLSSDVYPLGIANLAAYLRAYLHPDHPVDIKLFREPQDLKAALDAAAPDVFGLSNYAWNHELSLAFARYVKRRSPQVITLMGGPNFPLTLAEQESYLRELPEIDIAVRGPTYEGERAFLNVMRRLDEVHYSLDALQEERVPGNVWIHRRTGEFMHGGELERIRDLDEIPSPYLEGWLDPYFATGYFPILQISRGCPFSCTFCNSSVLSNSKIYRHSVENVKADLLYVAERIHPEITLCFADDNFGMYPWDEEIVDYFQYLQDRFGWPNYVRTTTGKNNHERIIRVMRKARGILPMTAAVQSMNPDVLKNIKRSNIKLETYAEIQKELKRQGMQAYGELILCLPGETKESFMKAVRDLLETGVQRISAHQLMLLHGAPLSNPESRQQYQFKTRFRVVARNIGNYFDEPIIEVEEMVVETPTFSFADYRECRVLHLLLTIYHYEGNFQEAFEFARAEGIHAFDLIVRMQKMLDTAPPEFQKLIADFLRESREELFATKDECIAWARQNFEGLVSGELGGNLLSKYSILGRFFVTQHTLDFLEQAIRAALGAADAAKLAQLQTVMNYLRVVLLHAPFAQTLNTFPQWETRYDIIGWRSDGYKQPLDAYRLVEPVRFGTDVEAKRKAIIESRLATFGEHPSGMGKFTRTMFAQDLRRNLISSAQPVRLA